MSTNFGPFRQKRAPINDYGFRQTRHKTIAGRIRIRAEPVYQRHLECSAGRNDEFLFGRHRHRLRCRSGIGLHAGFRLRSFDVGICGSDASIRGPYISLGCLNAGIRVRRICSSFCRIDAGFRGCFL
jgi:hypothetical protein